MVLAASSQCGVALLSSVLSLLYLVCRNAFMSSVHLVSGRPERRLGLYRASNVGSHSNAFNVHLFNVSVATRRAHFHFRRRCIDTQSSMCNFAKGSSASCAHLHLEFP